MFCKDIFSPIFPTFHNFPPFFPPIFQQSLYCHKEGSLCCHSKIEKLAKRNLVEQKQINLKYWKTLFNLLISLFECCHKEPSSWHYRLCPIFLLFSPLVFLLINGINSPTLFLFPIVFLLINSIISSYSLSFSPTACDDMFFVVTSFVLIMFLLSKERKKLGFGRIPDIQIIRLVIQYCQIFSLTLL